MDQKLLDNRKEAVIIIGITSDSIPVSSGSHRAQFSDPFSFLHI